MKFNSTTYSNKAINIFSDIQTNVNMFLINVVIFLLFPGTPLGKVLYNFESRSSSELQVNAGDLVKIINKKGCHIY